jgi:hypothetical protein
MISLYKKRTIGQSLTDAFLFYKENFKKMFIVLSILTLPLLITYILFVSEFDMNEFNVSNAILIFFVMIFGVFLSVVQNFISPFIIQHYIENNNEIHVSSLLKGFLSRFLSFLGVSFVYLGLIIAIYLGAILVGILFSFIPFLNVLVFILVFAFLIYMIVRFIFVFHIYAIEKVSVGHAFSKASKLINGNWWETFSIGLIIFLLYMSILATFLGVAAIFIDFESMFQVQDIDKPFAMFNSIFMVIYYILNIVLSVIFIPFAHMSFTMHYLNLMERSESKSVLNLVDDFGEDNTDE